MTLKSLLSTILQNKVDNKTFKRLYSFRHTKCVILNEVKNLQLAIVHGFFGIASKWQ